MWKERIKRFYNRGLWSKNAVAEAVEYGKITEDDYEEITGEGYGGEE